MNEFPEGTKTIFARAVAAEIRAELAAQRISGNQLAKLVGLSQNYVATRLRDEKPFTLDDIDRIALVLDETTDTSDFVARADRRHADRIDGDLYLLGRAAPAEPLRKGHVDLAARRGVPDQAPDTAGEESQDRGDIEPA